MNSEVIRFERGVCSRLDLALNREWLETNGLGGFASSTITGLNTRRYHGLLTAAMTPPTGRIVLLSKLEETLVAGDQRFELSANQYPGAIHPQGYQYLKEFRLDPFPVFVYQVGGLEIEKRVFMVHGENTTVIEYEIRASEPGEECFLELRPLVAFRDYHGTTQKNDSFDSELEIADGLVAITPYAGLPTLYLAHDAGAVGPSGGWYLNFEYRVERERGLDFQEDLFQPFVLRFDLNDAHVATVISSTEPHRAADAPGLREQERQRRAKIVELAPSGEPLVKALVAAADHYVVQRGHLKTIVAGYHWFTDWGRDTMIALPGLTLATGRFAVARQILQEFSQHVDRGMLPNRFPDHGETPEYNTVDATLWYFEAVRAYLHYSGDEDFVRDLYPTLQEIVDWHVRGTRYGIHVAADGLLACGEQGMQLTWMDAKIGDFVVTPRIGKPVEIQALWYNALCIMQDLAERLGDHGRKRSYELLASATCESFNAGFWNESADCLCDVVEDGYADGSIRPNQIFAVSLPHGMLSPERARRVVETVRNELLTPLGLRTLSRYDHRYRGRYEGGVVERDTAYHLGTVWPWLMGPFITAFMKVNDRSEAARLECQQWMAAFTEHLECAGLGQVSEIADGEFPHTPRGCIAQGWSVAELLRAAVEDVYRVQPSAGHASV